MHRVRVCVCVCVCFPKGSAYMGWLVAERELGSHRVSQIDFQERAFWSYQQF